jgi:hypothetical protein
MMWEFDLRPALSRTFMRVPALAADTHEVLSGSGRGGSLAEFDEQSIVWRKSATSGGGNCLEVATHDGLVLVRDSMDPAAVMLKLSPAAWSAFLAFARDDPVIRVIRADSF